MLFMSVFLPLVWFNQSSFTFLLLRPLQQCVVNKSKLSKYANNFFHKKGQSIDSAFVDDLRTVQKLFRKKSEKDTKRLFF